MTVAGKRGTRLHLVFCLCIWSAAATIQAQTHSRSTQPTTSKRGQGKRASLSAAQMRKVLDSYFGNKPGYQAGDLISQGDLDAILKQLAKYDWQPKDANKIRQSMLPETDFLVRLFATRNGQKFMRRVKSEKLIYDRLDRIARVPQGQQMLSDLVKLPDGHRYAATRRPRGAPDLLDLLPKRHSSRTRSIKDYEKPTGRIYTETQLRARLERSLRGPATPVR